MQAAPATSFRFHRRRAQRLCRLPHRRTGRRGRMLDVSGQAASRHDAGGSSLYVNHLAWPEDELFRTRAERTLRSVFADCSTWPVGIEEGRGWHAAREEPGTRRTSRWPPTSTAGPSCWRSARPRPAVCSGACWAPSPRASSWDCGAGCSSPPTSSGWRWPGSSLRAGVPINRAGNAGQSIINAGSSCLPRYPGASSPAIRR